MAVKERSGIAIGLNKGHVSPPILQLEPWLGVTSHVRGNSIDSHLEQKTTPRESKPRISRTKGHLSKRTAFVREIVKEVSGYVFVLGFAQLYQMSHLELGCLPTSNLYDLLQRTSLPLQEPTSSRFLNFSDESYQLYLHPHISKNPYQHSQTCKREPSQLTSIPKTSLAPYERRVIELLRNSKDKRARKLAKKRVRSYPMLGRSSSSLDYRQSRYNIELGHNN